MGMTIDEAIEGLKTERQLSVDNMDIYDSEESRRDALYYVSILEAALETMRKYQMMQADYENRLKADMVAMLTEIQLEIEELDLKDSVPDYQKGADETREYIADLLQQKIDSLKEVKQDKNFVPIILTTANGGKVNAFLYKPQCLIVTDYVTVEYSKAIGWSFEEVKKI